MKKPSSSRFQILWPHWEILHQSSCASLAQGPECVPDNVKEVDLICIVSCIWLVPLSFVLRMLPILLQWQKNLYWREVENIPMFCIKYPIEGKPYPPKCQRACKSHSWDIISAHRMRCSIFLWRLWGAYWPRSDGVILSSRQVKIIQYQLDIIIAVFNCLHNWIIQEGF